MVEFLSNSVPLTHGGRVYPWMHIRASDVTTNTLHVVSSIDMENNQITNLNIDNMKDDLSTLRWQVQSIDNPPLEGQIWIEFPLLNLPNDQEILIHKKCRLGRSITQLPNWTEIELIDITSSILYHCTLSNIQTSTDYYTMNIHVDTIVGTGESSSLIGSIVEIKPVEHIVSSLAGLSDVQLGDNLIHNQVLGYDENEGIWRNMTIDGSGHITSWSDIENKPATFPPEAHQHVIADITDFPSTMPPDAHQHVVADITDFDHTHNYSDLVGAPADTTLITKEPTGFDNPENVIITYNGNTRTITLGGSNWKAYWRGNEVTQLVPGWESTPHPNDYGSNFFVYWDDEGLIITTTPWSLDKLQIAYLVYGVTYTFGIRECHGLMQWQTHRHLHQTVGTYLVSGGDLSGYVLNSTVEADRRVNISTAIVADEDLRTTNNQLLKPTSEPVYIWFSLVNPMGMAVFDFIQWDIIRKDGNGILQYNINNNGIWENANFTNNAYGKIFVVAVPTCADIGSQYYRFIFIQPQQISASLNTIQAVSFANISFGAFSNIVPEFVPIAEIIVRQQNAGWVLISVNKITGTRQLLTSTNAGLTAVVTDNTTLTGSGTAGAPLAVSSSVLPHYYYPKFSFGGFFTFPNEVVNANGVFFYDFINRIICLTLVDTAGISHEQDIRKLDYSSVVQIYSGDKIRKARYIITQTSINDSNIPKYVLITFDPNFVEEVDWTVSEQYSFEFLLNSIQDLADLRDADITNPQSGQVITYENSLWINKTPANNKAFINIGWFNDVETEWQGSATYYFGPSTGGVNYNMFAPDGFLVDGEANADGIITAITGANTLGFTNVSGVTKKFLVIGKSDGRSTENATLSLGLVTGALVQVRKSRTHQQGITNGNASMISRCVVTMNHNDIIYLGGCTHSATARYNLVNIWLTVHEI
jgi:hypothetical protein